MKYIIVHEDKDVRDNLSALIKKIYPNAYIQTVQDGMDGFNLAKRQNSPCIIMIDINAPGIGGLKLLNKLIHQEKKTGHYYILLSGFDDRDSNIKAIKEGANDFLNKPYKIDDLIVKLRNANTQLSFINKEGDLKEKLDAMDSKLKSMNEATINLLEKIISDKYPIKEHLDIVREASLWIARIICGEPEDIELTALAGRLAYAGKLFLPENMITRPVMINGMVQIKKMEDIPDYAQKLLSDYEDLEPITTVLYHIFENFDGSGIPKKLKGWKIPIGSRIIRVCMDYCDLYERFSKKSGKAVEGLVHESKRLYDHRCVALFDQFLASHPEHSGARISEVPVLAKQLKPEMTISRNIITESGLKLISAGYRLTEEKIDKIINIMRTDPVIGKIYIQSDVR